MPLVGSGVEAGGCKHTHTQTSTLGFPCFRKECMRDILLSHLKLGSAWCGTLITAGPPFVLREECQALLLPVPKSDNANTCRDPPKTIFHTQQTPDQPFILRSSLRRAGAEVVVEGTHIFRRDLRRRIVDSGNKDSTQRERRHTTQQTVWHTRLSLWPSPSSSLSITSSCPRASRAWR